MTLTQDQIEAWRAWHHERHASAKANKEFNALCDMALRAAAPPMATIVAHPMVARGTVDPCLATQLADAQLQHAFDLVLSAAKKRFSQPVAESIEAMLLELELQGL